MWARTPKGQGRRGREAPSTPIGLRARAPGHPRAARRGRLVVKGLRILPAGDQGLCPAETVSAGGWGRRDPAGTTRVARLVPR